MDRHHAILQAIIQEFIETAQPVGSHAIVVSYDFSVSPATIRNEMANLEEEGYLFQPHTSAGRIPTDSGYRLYVDELADYEMEEKRAAKALKKVLAHYAVQKAREKIYDAVRILAQSTDNVSFATVPQTKRTFYLGLSNVLRKPEFSHDSLRASQVVELLEDDDYFVNTLRNLKIEENATEIFIGRENIFPQIQSCTLIVTAYRMGDLSGFIGLLGPTRMNYPFNLAMVTQVRNLI